MLCCVVLPVSLLLGMVLLVLHVVAGVIGWLCFVVVVSAVLCVVVVLV